MNQPGVSLVRFDVTRVNQHGYSQCPRDASVISRVGFALLLLVHSVAVIRPRCSRSDGRGRSLAIHMSRSGSKLRFTITGITCAANASFIRSVDIRQDHLLAREHARTAGLARFPLISGATPVISIVNYSRRVVDAGLFQSVLAEQGLPRRRPQFPKNCRALPFLLLKTQGGIWPDL